MRGMGPAREERVAAVCPECRGQGTIALLVNRPPFSRCAGTGRFDPAECDRPFSEARLLQLSVRAVHYLKQAGLRTLRQAAALSDAELSRVMKDHPQAMDEVRG